MKTENQISVPSTDFPPGVDRYVHAHNRATVELLAEIVPTASWQDLVKPGGVYAQVVAEADDATIAALGLIDRFFLLTVLLRRPDMSHPWLYSRCREVEADPDGCLDLWAREHGKSSIITFAGGIQEALRDPEITIGLFSHTRGIAKGFLRWIMRELQDNDDLKRLYPDVLWADPERQAPKWSESDGIVLRRRSNPKEATIEAWGLVDAMPTSRHYALRIYDDVVVKESVTTPEMVRKTIEARQLSDNLGKMGGREWNIGTRYSFADPYQDMIDRQVVTVRLHPATEDGQLDGAPVLLTEEAWEDKKRKQPLTVAAQMLQNPAAGQQGMFDLTWLKAYEVRPLTLNIYILCDPSKGRTSRSDRTAMAVIGVDAAQNKYLLDGYRHRMDLDQRWKAVKGLHRRWKSAPDVKAVFVGYEQYGMQSDLEYFEERMRVEHYTFAIEELAWPREGQHSKEDRVGRLVPDVKSGAFFVPCVVRHETLGNCSWNFDKAAGNTLYTPWKGDTKAQRNISDRGQQFRVASPIVRKDEAGKPYDLTAALIEELLYFPFGKFKDLVDAASRIYDMDPAPPTIMRDWDIEPKLYVDS